MRLRRGFRHAGTAALAAVSLLLISDGPLGAQASATGHITITTTPRIQPLRPPRRAARSPVAMARPAFDVLSWFDRTEPPTTLAPSPRGTIVLARELKVENRQYTLAPSSLVVVVDTLRVGPNGTIDVSGHDDGAAGGKIVVIARHVTCESGGMLNLIARGGPRGAAGGNVVVVAGSIDAAAGGTDDRRAERITTPRVRTVRPLFPGVVRSDPDSGGAATTEGQLPACIAARAEGGAGGTIEVRDHRAGMPATTTRTIPSGAGGRISALPLRAAVQADDLTQTAWSMWAVEWLETLQLDIYDASRRSDNRRVLNLLRSYSEFDGPIDLVSPDLRERYRSVLEDLNSYRRTALPPLTVEELSVRPGVVPQTVTVFTEGATLRATLAPTHVLALRTNSGGRAVLGLIDYQTERPDELGIEVEWELTIDPWVERLAAEQLTRAGQQLDGVFTGWSLEARPIQELGVRSAVATLLAGGRRLRVRLNVDAARANLVFWRLLSSGGIPWTIDWRFTEPNTGRVVTGTWAGPPLSLIHQREPLVTVTDAAIVNAGSSPVTVDYVRTKDGNFAAFQPAVRLKPGETIPLPAGVNAAGPVAIPPEAIETSFDPERFASDFHVLNDQQVVDRVTVRNNLPTSDPARGAFDYVEITVAASIEGDSTTPPAIAGPYVLAAAGTRGGEISIPLLRLSRGARRITIEGTAHYTDGSEWTLKPTTFDTLSVSITHDMLRQ